LSLQHICTMHCSRRSNDWTTRRQALTSLLNALCHSVTVCPARSGPCCVPSTAEFFGSPHGRCLPACDKGPFKTGEPILLYLSCYGRPYLRPGMAWPVGGGRPARVSAPDYGISESAPAVSEGKYGTYSARSAALTSTAVECYTCTVGWPAPSRNNTMTWYSD
jgi:hypothetical protein